MPRRPDRDGFPHRPAALHPDLRTAHQMRRAAKPAILLALFAVLAMLGLWLGAGAWHPSDREFPVQGIDVSHHQGVVDWHRLPAQGVDFAYIKATEGEDHRDRLFAANWAAAGASGIRRGAYHFFTLCRPGAAQAANFIAAVPAEADALPPAVDLEYGGNCAARPARAALLRELKAFIGAVERQSGKRAILYLTEE